MILRWHLSIYWYVMIILTIFLLLLVIPDEIGDSNALEKSKDKKIQSLADRSLKSDSAVERAAINRSISLERQKDSSSAIKAKGNLVPLKALLVVLMVIFTYMTFVQIWKKQFTRQFKKKSV